MTFEEAKKFLSEKLKTIYDNREAAIITDWMLEEITGLSKTGRLVHKEKMLSVDSENKLKKYADELQNHRPVQYVLGYADFMKMKFEVNESVLIPRPETEELVHLILQFVSKTEESKILDIGTGSGIIPVSLKKHLPNTAVSAIDISEEALAVARKNAEANHAEVEFILQDILQPTVLKEFPSFDVIVSNPPYILENERAEMDERVLHFEPNIALFVPNDNPLLFYEAVTKFAVEHLNDGGLLFFEINENFGKETASLLQQHGFRNIELKKDFQGKERMVKALFKK